ncbi:MAG: hypothetical protein ABH971_01085 [bacterium]
MIKRFFTKKSVATIFTAIILAGFFGFCFNNNVSAVPKIEPKNPTDYVFEPTTIQTVQPDKGTTVIGTGADSGAQGDISLGKAATSFLGNLLNYGAGIWALTTTPIGPIIGVLVILNTVISLIVVLSGILFDVSINFAIFGIGKFFVDGGVVSLLWTLIRDMFNISFIFILLYEAISKIIGNLGIKSKTTILNIIISAVLINFSMFIVKILIDAGNLVAIQFYNLINPATISIKLTISEIILSGTGILQLVKNAASLTGQMNMIISLILQIICMSILIWVFFYFAMIMIGRTVSLIFLTMTSPIGFMGKTIPGMKEHSDTWWKTFMDQILVAPFIMFFLFFITKIIETNTMAAILTISRKQFLEAPDLNVDGFFIYILLMVMLLQGLKYIKKLSGKTGEWSVKIIGTATAAIATAGLGAVAVGAGAVGAGASAAGAAASAAGASRIGALGARLAFSAKNIGESGVGKFVTGKYDKTGVGGWAQNLARERVMGGIKTATGGIVDVKKEEEKMKERTEQAKKNIEEKYKTGEGLISQEDINRMAVLKDTEKIQKKIKDEAEAEVEKETGMKSKTKKEKEVVEKDLEEKKKNVIESQENFNKAIKNGTREEVEQTSKVSVEARNNLQKAEESIAKYKEFEKTLEKKLEEKEEKIAEEMGTSLERLKEESEELGKIKTNLLKKQGEYLRDLSKTEQGIFKKYFKNFLIGDELTKTVNKLRLGEKDKTEKKQAILKALKEMNIFEKKEEKEETEKKEEKPKLEKEKKA